MTHTPGPWKYEQEPNGLTFSVWYNDDIHVAEAALEEDARLIAAAPDLLEALKELVITINNDPDHTPTEMTIRMVSDAVQAIKKATG